MAPLALALSCTHGLSARAAETLPAVVVTGTRIEQSSFDLPMAIDTVSADSLHAQKLETNISESLARVPGVAVGSRETYAQEQQLTLRGFGSRSQFGVRGIRLLADGIPASTPDGQGGSGLFDLSSAARIEVLRGPFSALYGNHSGGVVQVFTEDGPAQPTLSGSVMAGSWGTLREALKFGGTAGSVNYIGSLSNVETDGYRDHSAATKQQANVKMRVALTDSTSITLVGNYLNQPTNQDPLGLTADQVRQNRRQAIATTGTFDTRRSLRNEQGGAVLDTRLSAQDSIRATVYLGTRSNQQFLPIGGLGTGVSAFDRDYWGAGLRWTHRQGALTTSLGAEYDRAVEDRRGFRNNSGVQGLLTRDETNTVDQSGIYAQAEWAFAPAWSLSGGLRYTRLRVDSRDHFIVPGSNPDDSGSTSFSAWTPAAGLLWKLDPAVNLYANVGRSFETPTLIELAYRPDGTNGLNLGLQPSTSTHFEIGAKTILASDIQLTAALFEIRTHKEIVVFSNANGRTTYQNAGDTRRRGLEVALDAPLPGGFAAYLSGTWLEAKFRDAYLTCASVGCTVPTVTVNAGNRIPGVPNFTVYGELNWKHAASGFSAGVEARWVGPVNVDDRNSATAGQYTVANLRAGFEQRGSAWTLAEFIRIDNLFDKEYIGAVYVNDASSRFYAPAPERTFLLGLSAQYRF
ncbi:MAG: TonB-dependent receptor [Rhodocyclaceae bacterium]|nr:TonB-dependent receptor [Rhodocyclaceae bacterium]